MPYESDGAGIAALHERAARVVGRLRPPPKLTVDQWADRYRYLSPEASAERGKWYNARAPYLVEPMRALSPTDPTQWVVCQFPSQDGKTEIALNFLGYLIDQDPGPAMVTQPNVTPMGATFSKDRLAPMLRDTPQLRGKVREARSRDSGNTIAHKQFPGGHITINGANSPAGLASRPIRYYIGDELDRWPQSAGTEGSPLGLAEKRTRRFWNRKILLVSSPTYEGVGIDAQYARTDKAQWQLRCLHCEQLQFPKIRHLVAKRRPDDPAELTPADVVYVCEQCGAEHDHTIEHDVKQTGQWVVTNPGAERRGFWKNGISSTFTSWRDVLVEWLTVKDDPAELQVFVNTVLAEPWRGSGKGADETVLYTRRERYPAAVPDGVEVLVAGVDVQKDRVELEIVGYGVDRQSWGILYRVLYGDTTERDVWLALDEALQESFERADGSQLPVACALVDSGYNAQHVYDFCRPRMGRGVFATKGVGGTQRPIVGAPSLQKTASSKRKTPVFPVGVDVVKGIVYTRLIKAEPGPGFCHFPLEYGEEYFASLTAEHLVPRIVRGEVVLSWEKRRAGARNEALDIRVLAEAALWKLNPPWLRMRGAGKRTGDKPRATAAPQPSVAQQILKQHQRQVAGRRRRGGYVKRY